MQLLHNRLGHPNKHAMQIILKTQTSHIVNHYLSFCDACHYGKLHQFHFPVTNIKTRAPLELIHTDPRDQHQCHPKMDTNITYPL